MFVDLQVNPTAVTWPRLLDAARQAEDDGFDAFWVYDHLAGATLGGKQILECFTTLGALAAVTSRISLGTMVVNMSLREPAIVVSGAASVQLISGRPFLLGLGAGAGPTSRWATELHASGVKPLSAMVDRHARVERVLDLSERMWASDRSDELATFLLPSPPPVRLVGVNSLALARLAGRRADGINLWWHHPRRKELLDAADEAAVQRRLQPEFIRTAWIMDEEGLRHPDHPIRHDLAAAGIHRLILVRRLATAR